MRLSVGKINFRNLNKPHSRHSGSPVEFHWSYLQSIKKKQNG